MSRGRLSAFYSALTDTILFPYLVWPIIAGTLKIPKSKFEVTPKENTNKRNSNLIYTLPFILLIVLYILTIIQCIKEIVLQSNPGALPVLYWSFYNILTLVLAVFFYFGKHITKLDLMIKAEETITLKNDHTASYQTNKMGDDIFSIIDCDVDDFAQDDLFTGNISNGSEKISFLAKKYSYNNHTKKITFEIVEWFDNSKSNYLELLYDRPITLPNTVWM